ncbi:hypothetical protein CO101_00880 [Candidatus Berkelbacteria bacterium CG_4_9_14_3_um_filter_39_23]|uniref:Uncharacterized protein n=1 Tax=Candidatus Berkelbacteria bacterium CG_4_9_14_3_um_filter_39_23 TaxID=1974508 RepID=A0A2M8C667_9BACT|nr:hypothetical protein [Candidatus Berkelbacteria bacterium]OIP05960.1 MAG: hypothetical protein AUK14_00680 [Candidatus Berkelbacteria bacterium CG2_30_39_44]PIR27921.1 MAG: hypothetical protein COV39_01895 [Candidatus Berkelbacteria bacterium CG11_big_fil_rev_8_21_14_0_20_40_23]PIX30919.1 MAG: hypothetical protein COZ62_00025 [Candidatus Berkelbacteria bacterium CG_4_8_14_3_um_filter_39_27]PIZ29052.1 MAG: hypothetical protein COY44_00840 [Candidatus Berkelbacteria bacterium CG_4_10_14_0_8_um
MIDLLQKVLADPPVATPPPAVAPTGIPNLEATNNIFGFDKVKNAYEKLSGYNNDYPHAVLEGLAGEIITALMALSASLAVLMIVWAGIQYLTAYGNEDKTASAKKTITWALVGLAIVALVFTILEVTAILIK